MRPATLADLPLLRAWDAQPHVLEARGGDAPEDWTDALSGADPAVWTFLGEEDGRPFAYVGIIDPREEASHYWGDCPPNLRAVDIWIGDPADLGRGLGTTLMRLALAHCFADPAIEAVLIDPIETNTAARRFYVRLGFTEVGPRRFDDDDCMVYRLDRAAWTEGRG